MKKVSLLIASFALVFGASAQTSSSCVGCEVSPNPIAKSSTNNNKALWTVQLDANPTSIGVSLAGVIWTGTEFWAAVWNANTIYTANASGASTGSFTIPGITGARSITTDGTDIYIGTAGTSIYRVNKTTKTLISTIATSVPACRYVAYDPTLNSNAGGFWTGSFGSNIVAVSMTGATLSTITAATHGRTGIYGMAYDPYSTGGPFLWAYDQGTTAGQNDLVQLTMAGVPTGLTHDANSDLAAPGIAGGLFICNNFVSGKNSIVGISQGGSLFAYELADPLPIDCQMDVLTNSKYAAAGNLTITGTIRNTGLNTITSATIDWNDGSPHSQVFPVNITANNTYNFSHGTQLAVVAGTTHNLTVTVTVSGDGNPANNSKSISITGLSSIPTKKTVGEEKTGTWCGWCPRGAVGLANMEAQNNFIGIAVHNGDALTVSSYDGALGTYIPGGYPGGGVDRVIDGDPNASNFLAMHNARKNTIVPCEVSNIVALYNTATNKIQVSADAVWYGTIPGNFRMSCVIVEDNVISSNQVNYYGSGGAGGPGGTYDNNGPMAFPTGINNAFNFYGAATSVVSTAFLGYDHTARSLSNNSILGDAGSLPAGSVPIGTHPWTFADVNSSVVSNASNSHAVVMIIDQATGEILNADEVPLSIGNSVADLKAAQYQFNVYPNPTNLISNVSFNLPEAALVTMEVYNTMGSLVYTNGSENMTSGKHNLSFNGSELSNGIYFINLTIGNELITKKVSLLK